MSRNPVYYDVRPRYTGGSPAQVDKATCLKVAAEEREHYGCTMEGVFGPEQKARAERLGLTGIAFSRLERRSEWIIEDQITNERTTRPFDRKVKRRYAKHPTAGRVEVELLGEDPDDSYHCFMVRLVRTFAVPMTFSVPRHELELVTTGKRRS